nr:hypothetical protein [Marinicella sp. W31]MDC2879180.1 hypothetical protein [Marinicella sp. W31]
MVRYRFPLPGLSVMPEVTYRVGGDGLIHVTADFPGGEDLPDLPIFGLQFTLGSAFDRFRYYGLGPEENYADRVCGARLGIFERTVAGNLSPYSVPQECGNRMGTRFAEVIDEKGRGCALQPRACRSNSTRCTMARWSLRRQNARNTCRR